MGRAGWGEPLGGRLSWAWGCGIARDAIAEEVAGRPPDIAPPSRSSRRALALAAAIDFAYTAYQVVYRNMFISLCFCPGKAFQSSSGALLE